MNLELLRLCEREQSTLGILSVEGMPLFCTLELAWNKNAHNFSCIPLGNYMLEIAQSPHFGEVWEVRNVPERAYIYFHSGNTRDDTHGCILIGMQFGYIDNKPAVLRSKQAEGDFHRLLQKAENVRLSIVERCQTQH